MYILKTSCIILGKCCFEVDAKTLNEVLPYFKFLYLSSCFLVFAGCFKKKFDKVQNSPLVSAALSLI